LEIKLWRLNRHGNGIEPIPGPRTDEQGRAYAGSQRQVQLYVNRHPEVLNQTICMNAPELRGCETAITWVSPRAEQRCREYRDEEALEKLGYRPLVDKLRRFWPARGPQWDALATVRMNDGKVGVILVEAKSHVDEVASSGTAARDARSLRKIRQALEKAKDSFGVRSEVNWLGPYYQSANRLAHLYFFRREARIPAWLINLYFTNDPTGSRQTTRETWVARIAEVKRALGCDAADISFAHDVLLDSLRERWSSDDEER
jgi:hypothetical protein